MMDYDKINRCIFKLHTGFNIIIKSKEQIRLYGLQVTKETDFDTNQMILGYRRSIRQLSTNGFIQSTEFSIDDITQELIKQIKCHL